MELPARNVSEFGNAGLTRSTVITQTRVPRRRRANGDRGEQRRWTAARKSCKGAAEIRSRRTSRPAASVPAADLRAGFLQMVLERCPFIVRAISQARAQQIESVTG